MDTIRTCTDCGQTKPIEEFVLNYDKNRGKSYRRHRCMECKNKAMRRSRQEDPERFAKYEDEKYAKRKARFAKDGVNYEGEKTCGKCGLMKPRLEFSPCYQMADGLHSWCKLCHRIRASARKANKNGTVGYTISEEEFQLLYEKQNGRCKLCGRHESELSKPLSIDHNHITGKIRGLLCFDHNTAIGKFNDDPELLVKALQYVLLDGNIELPTVE